MWPRALCFLLLAVPFAVNAQATLAPATQCPVITKRLSLGSQDPQVIILKKFLVSQEMMTPTNYTIYFGPLTQAALQKWQCAKGIICSGNPKTTGYGATGPATRAALTNCNSGSGDTGDSGTLPITHSWNTGTWSPCVDAVQSRSVFCISSTNASVVDTLCTSSKPPVTQSCTVSTPPQCTPLNPETRIQSCPTGQTGTITQARASSCPGPQWSDWSTIANTCTEPPPATQSCALGGLTIAHGAAQTFYSAYSVAYGSLCTAIAQTRTCNNGVFSGTDAYKFANCAAAQAAQCTWNGSLISHGTSVIASLASTVPYGQQCQTESRACANGTLSGSYTFASCAVGAPQACLLDGLTVNHSSSQTFYSSQSVSYGQNCSSVAQARTCTNGALSGSVAYQYAQCTAQQPLSCTFNGQSVAHGGMVTAYQSSNVTYGNQCVSQARTCSNGTLGGTYTYSTCSVGGAMCTPLAPQTQTLSCPNGQAGSITQKRLSTCADGATSPTWSAWLTTGNTCTLQDTFGTVSSNYQPGGTDFAVYDLVNYATNITEGIFQSAAASGGMRFVLNHYNLDPNAVRNQLTSMCVNGQHKIGFELWHMEYAAATNDPAQWPGGLIDSTNGKVVPQLAKNIQDVMTLLPTLKRPDGSKCFDEIQVRFIPIGSAAPTSWDSWHENMYQSNKTFLLGVRNIVEDALRGSGTRRFYDLGGELGGGESGSQDEQYTARLWKEYTQLFGTNDSYGFSVALVPGRMAKLIHAYDLAGTRPDQYAIDIYDFAISYQNRPGMVAQLEPAIAELTAAGEIGKPVIIQETYYDDPTALSDLSYVRAERGLKIRTIMQWQSSRSTEYRPDGNLRHFAIVPVTNYPYASLMQNFVSPTITSSGYGCDDHNCGLVSGTGFSAQCRVDLYSFSDPTQKLATLDKKNLLGFDKLVCGDSSITFRIPDAIIASTNKLYFTITNTFNRTTERTYLSFGL